MVNGKEAKVSPWEHLNQNVLVFGLVAERPKMPCNPSSESRAVLNTKTPWRAVSGAALAIPARRLDTNSVVPEWLDGWKGLFLRKPRPAPSGGERLFAETIPF